MALTRPRIGQLNTNVFADADPITVLHAGATAANVDVGFLMNRANGLVSNVALYWSESGNTFVTAFTSNTGITDTNISVTSYANVTTGVHTITTSSTINSTSTSTGALVVTGGVGISGNLYVGGNISAANFLGNVFFGPTPTPTYYTQAPLNLTNSLAGGIKTQLNLINTGGGAGAGAGIDFYTYTSVSGSNYPEARIAAVDDGNYSSYITFQTKIPGNTGANALAERIKIDSAGNIVIPTTTVSTSTTTGALVVAGGSGIAGNVNVGGNITQAGYHVINSNIGVAALQITGTATKGGAGYHDFLSVTNQGGGTNPSKWFRMNNTGNFEIINSAYTTNIFTLTDAGALTVPAISIGGSLGTSGQVLQSTGTGLQWAASGGFSGGSVPNQTTFASNLVASSGTSSTSSTTGALVVVGGIGTSGNVWAGQFYSTNNGNGTNFAVGDDVWIGDINIANTMGIRGQQDATQGYIVFGNANNTNYIGRNGSNPITVTGAFTVTGNLTVNGTINAPTIGNSGATLTGTLSTASQTNITGVGTLTGLTLSGALTQSSTTAGTITSVLTHGADVNFQLTSQNGTSLNTTGQEVARFGINYNTAGWDSFTQYIRGSAAQNGNQVLWAANTAIATISTSGITLNTGTFTGTIGTSGANTTVAGGLVVAGNLYAQGTLTYVNTETVNTTEYVSTVNATNLYATTIGNIGANLVGTGTYLTSLNASNLSSGTVSASLIPTLNQNTTGSAGSLSGFGNPTTSSTASTIVYRDTNGYITNNYFYTSGGGAERNASGMGYFAGFNSSDYYIRSYSPAAVAAAISGQTMNIVGSASTATSASTAGSTAFFSAPDGDRNAATKLPTTSGHGVRGDFVSASSAGMAGGNYAGVLTYAPWDGTTASTGDASYQLAFGSTATNGSGYPQLNLRKGIDSTWNAWYNIYHSGQTNSPSADNTWNLGTASLRYATVYGVTFSGVSTTAKYADLAENYISDSEYAPGTVVVFGGNKEITISTQSHDTTVAGIISTNPAYLMNSEADGLPVALTGRVPCQVQGPVTKGQVLVTSTTAGVAEAIDNSKFLPGCVVGKALEAINTNTIETIEVVVGRF